MVNKEYAINKRELQYIKDIKNTIISNIIKDALDNSICPVK